jgi:hypothetical protein
MGLKSHASGADACSRTLSGIEAVNVPEHRFFKSGELLDFNDAASNLTATLGRVLDAHRFFLRLRPPVSEDQKKCCRYQKLCVG